MILERESDLTYVAESERAYRKILAVLNRVERGKVPLSRVFDVTVRSYTMSYGMRLSDHVSNVPGLILVVRRGSLGLGLGGQVVGGFGSVGSRKIIVLSLNERAFELFKTRPRTMFNVHLHDAFIHEFSHYMTDRRMKGGEQGSKKKADVGDATGYYNEPGELQSYFIEIANENFRLLKILCDRDPGNPMHRKMLGSHGRKEWVNWVLKTKAENEFVKALTPKNRRRIIKRLATFYDDVVLPSLPPVPSRMDERHLLADGFLDLAVVIAEGASVSFIVDAVVRKARKLTRAELC